MQNALPGAPAQPAPTPAAAHGNGAAAGPVTPAPKREKVKLKRLSAKFPGLTLSALLLAAGGSRRRDSDRIVPEQRHAGPAEGGALRPAARRAGAARPAVPRRGGAAGEAGRITSATGRRVLVLAYYRCPMLCDMVMQAAESGLKPLSLDPGKDFDVVVASIDPADTPERAAMKKRDILQRYARPGTEGGWHFLTGAAGSITRSPTPSASSTSTTRSSSSSPTPPASCC